MWSGEVSDGCRSQVLRHIWRHSEHGGQVSCATCLRRWVHHREPLSLAPGDFHDDTRNGASRMAQNADYGHVCITDNLASLFTEAEVLLR